MKTLTRIFKKGTETFTVTGRFAFMNGLGEIQVDGDASGFEKAAKDKTGVPVAWESMSGEMFQGAFTRDPMGWEIRTEEDGEWGVLES
ncbi:hypothetical protein P0Y35_08685 [Kiritimatiellaeota bacterium B1221]|nr:hypothetical protein [Kiritimatiellaeota bacterium B1221]